MLGLLMDGGCLCSDPYYLCCTWLIDAQALPPQCCTSRLISEQPSQHVRWNGLFRLQKLGLTLQRCSQECYYNIHRQTDSIINQELFGTTISGIFYRYNSIIRYIKYTGYITITYFTYKFHLVIRFLQFFFRMQAPKVCHEN